ncbi:hypothetical protein PR048_020161 [Dryococelus australis]|uniref:Uncharacterized protein n=1 Tax=Dryococelus australis TaxID=614101 RepID=A0ABQ9H5J7_9NEOP|nr:hypothetical protein PR048_020161 [Dryococelus australis]
MCCFRYSTLCWDSLTMDKAGRGFMYLSNKFPRLSPAKIEEGVFLGPQIRELQKDPKFRSMSLTKRKVSLDVFHKCHEKRSGQTKSYKQRTGELYDCCI